MHPQHKHNTYILGVRASSWGRILAFFVFFSRSHIVECEISSLCAFQLADRKHCDVITIRRPISGIDHNHTLAISLQHHSPKLKVQCCITVFQVASVRNTDNLTIL